MYSTIKELEKLYDIVSKKLTEEITNTESTAHEADVNNLKETFDEEIKLLESDSEGMQTLNIEAFESIKENLEKLRTEKKLLEKSISEKENAIKSFESKKIEFDKIKSNVEDKDKKIHMYELLSGTTLLLKGKNTIGYMKCSKTGVIKPLIFDKDVTKREINNTLYSMIEEMYNAN